MAGEVSAGLQAIPPTANVQRTTLNAALEEMSLSCAQGGRRSRHIRNRAYTMNEVGGNARSRDGYAYRRRCWDDDAWENNDAWGPVGVDTVRRALTDVYHDVSPALGFLRVATLAFRRPTMTNVQSACRTRNQLDYWIGPYSQRYNAQTVSWRRLWVCVALSAWRVPGR